MGWDIMDGADAWPGLEPTRRSSFVPGQCINKLFSSSGQIKGRHTVQDRAIRRGFLADVFSEGRFRFDVAAPQRVRGLFVGTILFFPLLK